LCHLSYRPTVAEEWSSFQERKRGKRRKAEDLQTSVYGHTRVNPPPPPRQQQHLGNLHQKEEAAFFKR